MRWAQLAFVEDDPGNYDQQFWLDYFRSVHADAACLSAGGVVAFYPTQTSAYSSAARGSAIAMPLATCWPAAAPWE